MFISLGVSVSQPDPGSQSALLCFRHMLNQQSRPSTSSSVVWFYSTIFDMLRPQSDLAFILLQAKLAQPDPRDSASQHKHTRNNNSPMLNLCHIQAVSGPRRGTNGREAQRRDQVAAQSVVLVDALRTVYAAVNTGCVVLCESNDGLDVYQYVEC